MHNDDLNDAIIRIVPNINLNEIKKLIYSIPNNFKEFKITSNIQKEFYYRIIEFRYNNILLPIFKILKDKFL